MLRRIELAALATVERGDTISELATKLDHRESYLSRAVGGFIERALVYMERDGRRKRVVPSDARAVEVHQDPVGSHSHIDFPELLTGKALEVLYYFDRPRTVATQCGNYRKLLRDGKARADREILINPVRNISPSVQSFSSTEHSDCRWPVLITESLNRNTGFGISIHMFSKR